MKAMRTGKAVPGYEARINRSDGSKIDVMMSANPLFDEYGKVRGAIGALVDVSTHKKAERDQDRLLHELQHRVKNILATINALSSRMMRSSSSMTDFSAAFQLRLQAMARTHELLSSSSWGGADLQELLWVILAPYAGSDRQNVVMASPAFRLNASAVPTLGMIFFELASNAAKYGALATTGGRVSISWRVAKPGSLSIAWKEVGGPPVPKPPKRNFGTTFIEQSLDYELGGHVELKFKRSGLECLLEIPLSKAKAPEPSSPPAPGKA